MRLIERRLSPDRELRIAAAVLVALALLGRASLATAGQPLVLQLKNQTGTGGAAAAAAARRLSRSGFKAVRVPFRRAGAALYLPDPNAAPEITAVTPVDCVTVGDLATAGGANLGSSRQAAGFALGIQVNDGTPFEIAASSWSPTAVGFTVPPAAGAADWFALGIIYESQFYPQQYVSICSASPGGGGGGYESPGAAEPAQPAVSAPKGARLLGPGGVDVTVAPPPAAEAPPAQPQQPGRPAIGGKQLAMKALAKRGLRKVDKECDLFAPHCPCCREGGAVCLEKQGDNEDGTSTWVVRWREAATAVDGTTAYDARAAEEDVEAVTALACEIGDGEAADDGRVARLYCR